MFPLLYVSNGIMHFDLKVKSVHDEIKFHYKRFHNRPTSNHNPSIQSLAVPSIFENPLLRLKCEQCHEEAAWDKPNYWYPIVTKKRKSKPWVSDEWVIILSYISYTNYGFLLGLIYTYRFDLIIIKHGVYVQYICSCCAFCAIMDCVHVSNKKK